ncbi:MAG: hypothetical protein LC721_08650 [Actinobacteria bacterium]|nr:hypothetical protein [Actinomycetota bacterium]
MTTQYPPIPDSVPLDQGRYVIDAWIAATYHVMTVDLIMDGTAPYIGDVPVPRELTYQRPGPGELVYRAPECGLCNNECYHNGDGWACETCEAYWPESGGFGDWEDPNQCLSMYQPWLTNKFADPAKRQDWVRCHLSQGHKTEKHRADFLHAWYDDGRDADPWS